jgi:hypothetical protein
LAYIGNIPAESYASFETETFSVSATANYTLSHAVANENEIRLVINGVVQQPGSGKAYTASGTTLTLTSATVSGDVMYAVYLGRALQTVNPPNASVGLSQLSATGTKSSSTFLRGDNTFDTPPLGGITMAEQWRLATTLSCSSTNTNVDVTANLEKVDTNSPGTIGSSMSESSGIFTFPSTGIYLILSNYLFYSGSATSQYSGLLTRATTDNSSYSYATENYLGIISNYNNGSSSFIFDVTNTSTHKVKFTYFTQAAVDLRGNTSNNTTSFSFIRLGDT